MSILPGSFSASVERINALPAVRRVERDRGADEFNRKQQDAQDDKPDQDEMDDAIPEDVVDVSEDYQAATLPAAVPASRHAVSPLHTPPAALERHIDIEG